jgi:hypothetical protein
MKPAFFGLFCLLLICLVLAPAGAVQGMRAMPQLHRSPSPR